jgi:uncharacterized repeat protein (TIGR01451 family)
MSTQNAPRNLSLDRTPADSGPNSSLSKIPIPSIRLFRPRAAILLVAVLALGLAASLNSVSPRAGLVNAFSESINTLSADCTTPKTVWDLGQTACAAATGATGQRRIFWVTPDGTVADVSDPFSGNASDTYTFETSGPLAQYGTWTVRTVDDSGSGFAVASFLVRNAAVDNVDLVVSIFGPDKAIAGGAVSYRIEILNRGPNVAQNVVLTESVPNNTTFASEAQDSGPSAICGNPSGGGTGTSTCTIPSLAVNEAAVFTFVYNVNAGTPVETIIVNTASVASSTNELFQNDNTARNQVAVAPGTGSPACTIACPADISVNNNASDPNPCVKEVTYTTPTASGGCADPDTGEIPPVVCSPPSGSDFPIGASSVVCSTGSTNCSFTITVNETRGPVTPTIVCPSDVTAYESSPGSGSARVNFPAPTTTGNCVSVVCNPQSGDLFAVGTTTVTCNGTDSANTPVSCAFSVTVNVSTCGLDCPADTTVNESSPGSGSATVTYSTPTTTGTCPTVTIVCNPASGSSFPVGTTQVSCTATESSSVLAICSFSVTVIGSSTCTITCPANITQTANTTCSGNPCATVTYSLPTKSGSCSTDPVVCSPPSGSTFGVGTTTVHCTASDASGNAATCNFTVTVTGGTPCTISCPANVTDSSSGCGKTVTYSNPTTTGSCGNGVPPWSCNPPSDSFFPVGTTTVVCTTDVGAECSFTITITGTDAVAPVISSCGPARFALADANSQGVVPNVTGDVEATDNCTPTNLLTITQNPAPGTLVGIGTTTITVTVKDANNNTSTCTTTFKVCAFEQNLPTALCKNITVALPAGGIASINGSDVDNGSSDDCGIVSRTVSPSTFTCADKGPNTVTLTVIDPSGNSASCQATVTVVDNTPPTISCPANVVQSTDPNLCTAVVTYSNATATDNCPGVGTPACSPASGATFPKGTTTVTCTATDASSNTSACSFTVTVNDTQPPTITCPANITNEPTCPAGAVATFTAVAADNCSGATASCSPPSGSVFPIGTTTVTCTATDTSGNHSTPCSFTVRVKTAAQVIQDLITRVQALTPPLTGTQSQGLVSKLQAALAAVNDNKINVACNKLGDFISQLTGLINNGTLTSAQGQPLLNSAAHVRNTLGCTNLGCS